MKRINKQRHASFRFSGAHPFAYLALGLLGVEGRHLPLHSLPDFFAELVQPESGHLVALLERAERFAHHFARGLVAAGLDLALDELLQLGGKRDIHTEKATASNQVCQILLYPPRFALGRRRG